MNGPREVNSVRATPRNYGIALFTAASGLLISVLLYAIADRTENRYLQRHFANNARSQLTTIRSQVEENERILAALQELIRQDPEAVRTAASVLRKAFSPTLLGTVWLGPLYTERAPSGPPFSRLSEEERDAWLNAARRSIQTGRELSLPLVQPDAAGRGGVDVDAPARASGASPDASNGSRASYLCSFFPLSATADSKTRRPEQPLGIGAVVDLGALTSLAKTSVTPKGIDLWWFDVTDPSDPRLLDVSPSRFRYLIESEPPTIESARETGLIEGIRFTLGDREYQVEATAVPEFIGRSRSRLPVGVLLSSVLFTALLTILLQSNVNRDAVVEEMTAERTRSIEESRRRMRAVMNSLQCGIFVIDAETERIVEANPAALSLVGASEGEVTGARCDEYLVSYQDASYLDGEYAQSCSLRTASGKLIPVYHSAVGTVIGGKRCLIDNFVDVRSMLGAERTLHRLLQRQRDMFEAVAESVLLVREDGTVIECNTAAGRAHGRSRDELLASSCDTLYRSYRGCVPIQDEWRKAMGDAARADVAVQALRAEAGPVGTHLCVNPFEHHAFRGWLLVERPMGARSRKQSFPRQPNPVLESRVPTGDILWAGEFSCPAGENVLSGRFDYLNDAGEAALGYTNDSFASLQPGQVFSDDAVAVLRDRLAAIVRSGGPDDFPIDKELRLVLEYRTSSGELVECLTDVTVLLRIDESTIRVVAVAKPGVEGEKAEYRFSVEDFRAITDSTLDAVIVMGPDGKPAHWNRAAEKIFGYAYDEIKDRRIHDVLTPERFRAAAEEGFSRFLESGAGPLVGRLYRTSGIRKGGEEFPMEICLSAFRLKGRWWASAFVRDITERETAERELKEYAQAMETANRNLERLHREARAAVDAKGAFLANMSHEIRTPINGVLGMTRLLLDTDLSPEQLDYALAVLGSADSLLTIVNDILDFSKIEAGQLDLESIDFDIQQLLEATVNVVAFKAREKHLDLTVRIDPKVPRRLRGDSGRLRQVLLNLLNNAIKFTHEGAVEARVSVNELHDNHVLLDFEISDTGIGISEEMREKLFDPFTQADVSTTRKYGGTGLGLSICRSLVELMGGTIGCESRLGEGSVFSFTALFDVRDTDSEPAEETPRTLPAAEAPLLPHGKPARILLAEDNPTNQKVAAHILKKLGYGVTVVEDGREAVDAVAEQDFDLVLMDIQMPHLDGIEATRMIRGSDTTARNPRIPIVALSAHAMKGDREQCLDAGMDDYISKPVQPEVLSKTIRLLLLARADEEAESSQRQGENERNTPQRTEDSTDAVSGELPGG